MTGTQLVTLNYVLQVKAGKSKKTSAHLVNIIKFYTYIWRSDTKRKSDIVSIFKSKILLKLENILCNIMMM